MVQGPTHGLRPHNMAPAVYHAGPQQATRRDSAHSDFMKMKMQACEEGGSPPCLFLEPPSPNLGALGQLGGQEPAQVVPHFPRAHARLAACGTAAAGTSGLSQMVHASSPDWWPGPRPPQGNEEAPRATADTGPCWGGHAKRVGTGPTGAPRCASQGHQSRGR